MSIDTAKPRRGRPRVDSEEVSVRMTRPTLDAVDAWISAQPDPRPNRPEAIRRLVAEALGGPAASTVKAPASPPPLPQPSEAFQRALVLSKARKARALGRA
jgi:hypothetical protein